MTTYIVSGADRNTGEDVRREYTAPNAQEAEYTANEDGVLVSNVEEKNRLPVEWEWELPPLCPHCGVDLCHRTSPLRSSKFRCDGCEKAIYVDPHQFLYKTPYLDEVSNSYAEILDHMKFCYEMTGDKDSYEQSYIDLKKQFQTKPSVRDVLWRLINLDLLRTRDFFDYLRIALVMRAILYLKKNGSLPENWEQYAGQENDLYRKWEKHPEYKEFVMENLLNLRELPLFWPENEEGKRVPFFSAHETKDWRKFPRYKNKNSRGTGGK